MNQMMIENIKKEIPEKVIVSNLPISGKNDCMTITEFWEEHRISERSKLVYLKLLALQQENEALKEKDKTILNLENLYMIFNTGRNRMYRIIEELYKFGWVTRVNKGRAGCTIVAKQAGFKLQATVSHNTSIAEILQK